MATIRLRFRPSSVSGSMGTLYYLVIHRRKTAMLSTGCRIYPHEWDSRRASIATGGDTGGDSRRNVLEQYRIETAHGLELMAEIAAARDAAACPYTAADIVSEFQSRAGGMSVFAYIRSMVAHKKEMECYGTARTYANALSCFMRFRGGRDIGFDGMSGRMMEEYEAWMLHAGLKRSSAACYIRTLRTLYRLAVADGLTGRNDIFSRVHVSVGKTRKRAVSADIVRAILRLDLTGKPSLSFARDIFMFSFYTRGMSFVDIAYLKKSNLRDGLLTYNRRKTFQCLTIQWEQPMQDIVDRYAGQTSGSPYFFPIIRGDAFPDRTLYENTLQRVNRNLKLIGRLVGLHIPLTTYVARHSWASIARHMSVPLSVISEGLGHDSDRTTQVYLASLDTSVINKANRKIISRIG